jgi:hypothetical protein
MALEYVINIIFVSAGIATEFNKKTGLDKKKRGDCVSRHALKNIPETSEQIHACYSITHR